MAAKRKSKGAYMISAVAEMYEIHPQTLRLYEREGLLKPSRTEGNTRLYTDEDLERLEFILNLARDLGVNIAGIAIILQMRERMEEMNRQMQSFVEYVRSEMLTRFQQAAPSTGAAIVPLRRPVVAPKTVYDAAQGLRAGAPGPTTAMPGRLRRVHSSVSTAPYIEFGVCLRGTGILNPACFVRSVLALPASAMVTSSVFAGMVLWAVPRFLAERRAALSAAESAAGIYAAADAAEADCTERSRGLRRIWRPSSSRIIRSTRFCFARGRRTMRDWKRRGAWRARYPQIPARFFRPAESRDYINAKVASMELMEASAATTFWSSATAMCA